MRYARVFGFAILAALAASASALEFSVVYPGTQTKPFSGRVVVYFGRGGEPRFGPNWFNPDPIYARDVKNVKPGEAVLFNDRNAIIFMGKESSSSRPMKVQAVFDLNLGGSSIGDSPGNLFSHPKTLEPADAGKTLELICDQTVEAPKFKETETVKEFSVTSKLLSDFYKRPTKINAAVALPPEFAEDPNRKFPVLYSIPGFGGTHFSLSGRNADRQVKKDGVAFVSVLLDPSCPGGHSVFADSANNGPWGKALTTELIPALEKQFRVIGTPETRLVTGHSSGGWSSLWLQVAYPDFFGGVWSTAPDPVDFRDFQLIDLYSKDVNMFKDATGADRPIARSGDRVLVTYKQFSDMERPLRGEQLESFEMVFSPRGKDGGPKRLWDRDTGMIDAKVAEAWKQYDISLILRDRWKTLGPKLKGKLRIYAGETDTFYLDGAVRKLKADLATLGSDAVVEMFPGDHGSFMFGITNRIAKEMADCVRPHLPKP